MLERYAFVVRDAVQQGLLRPLRNPALRDWLEDFTNPS